MLWVEWFKLSENLTSARLAVGEVQLVMLVRLWSVSSGIDVDIRQGLVSIKEPHRIVCIACHDASQVSADINRSDFVDWRFVALTVVKPVIIFSEMLLLNLSLGNASLRAYGCIPKK